MQSILFKWSDTQIYLGTFESRFETGKIVCERVISLVMDCKEQRIVRSTDCVIEGESFSGKYMEDTVIMLAGCDPSYGRVMFLSPSYLGKKNDQSCFNEHDWNKLLPDEFILTDKGFTAANVVRKHSKYKGVRLSDMQRRENREVDKHRIIIENVFGWCTKFAICGEKLRVKSFQGRSGARRLLNYHNEVWTIVCGVYNCFSSVRK